MNVTRADIALIFFIIFMWVVAMGFILAVAGSYELAWWQLAPAKP